MKTVSIQPQPIIAKTRPARAALKRQTKDFNLDGNRELMRIWLNALSDPKRAILVPPSTDWLTMGACFDPQYYEDVLTWLSARTFWFSDRIYIERGNIYVDGQKCGRVGGSRAGATRYGKKLEFAFTGKWFRTHDAPTKKGAGMNESEAFDLMTQFLKHLAVSENLVPRDFVKFHTIDRWDVVMELALDPEQCARHADKAWAPERLRDMKDEILPPHGMAYRNFHDSETGQSVYLGVSKQPLKHRGDYPHLNIYQDAGENTMRVELRIPKVRNVDPDKSFGQESAAAFAASVLGAFSPVELVVEPEDLAELPRYQRDDLQLSPRLDFGKVKPEEYARKPYGGAAPKQLRQRFRQGMTVLRRAAAAFTTASVLSSAAMAGDAFCHEIQAGPGIVRDVRCAAPTSFDVAGAPLKPEERAPFDHGISIKELTEFRAVNLDELYALQLSIELFRRRFLPASDPFWVACRGDMDRNVIPPDPAAPDTTDRTYEPVPGSALDHHTQFEVRRVVESDEDWIKRYLEPTIHEPLATRERWLVKADREELAYYPPGAEEPIAKIKR
ncbi:MAG: hypothetical protein CMM93_09120 [Rickettsiales bacterium]|nr:hypothetical protein [Rickettsiales bacterium]MAR57331.1 hypothetical protein [Rickettsiales bacterium]|tara:strand:- start:2357 stop:4027 length:1671 start_codon:yes stop_codon:yes gene_type:complete